MSGLIDFLRSDSGTLLLLAGLLVTLIGLAVFVVRVPERIRLSRELAKLTAEVGLTESVARLGYWSRNLRTHEIVWSPGMYALYGVSPDTFVPSPQNVRSFFSDHDLQTIIELTDPDKTDGKGGEAELRINCGDGTVKDILVATRFQFSRSRKLVGIFGVTIDISSRKAAERAVEEREEQLQAAIAAMGAAIWDWEIGSDRMYAGRRFAEILGLAPEAFKPTMSQHHQLCHPEDLPYVQEAFRRHVREGEPYDAEYRMRHSDGHYIWVHIRGRVVEWDGARPVRAIGTVVDITDRRNAIEELLRSRESLELAVQVSQAGYFDIDEATLKVVWSPRVREILGIADGSFEPNRRTLSKFIHEDDLPEYLAEIEEFQVHGTPVDMELRAHDTAGNLVWLHIRIGGQYNARGRRVRTIGFIRDISARRLAQQLLTDSEKKYRSLVEDSLQGIVIHRRFKPLFCN